MNSPIKGIRSLLLDTVERLPQQRAQGKQYLGSLKKKGVSPEELDWTGVNDWLENNDTVITREALSDFVVNQGVRVDEIMLSRDAGETTYDSLTLSGSHNYRELLLTLPIRHPKRHILENLSFLTPNQYDFDGHDMFWPIEATDQIHLIPKSVCTTPDEAIQYVIDNKALSYHEDINFQSSHFQVENIVAHLRLSTIRKEGRRTLLIEEIQSDWHQQGRRFGYKDIKPNERPQKYNELLLTPMFMPENIMAVPDAPFKNSRWIKLALKRALRLAVDEDFDELSWTPGVIQAERSGKSRSINKIRAHFVKQNNGERIWTFWGGSTAGPYQLLGSDLTTSDLRNRVGSEIFSKISDRFLDSTDNRKESVQLTDINIKLDNQGVAKFYDSIIPKTLKSILKPLDPNASIKDISIKTQTEVGTIYSADALRNVRDHILFESEAETQDAESLKRTRGILQRTIDQILKNMKSEDSRITSHSLNEIFKTMCLPTIEELGFSIYGGDSQYQHSEVKAQSLEITSTLRGISSNNLTLFQFGGPAS